MNKKLLEKTDSSMLEVSKKNDNEKYFMCCLIYDKPLRRIICFLINNLDFACDSEQKFLKEDPTQLMKKSEMALSI